MRSKSPAGPTGAADPAVLDGQYEPPSLPKAWAAHAEPAAPARRRSAVDRPGSGDRRRAGTGGHRRRRLYARHRANSIVSTIVSCVVQDKADASFGGGPAVPVAALQRALHQHLRGKPPAIRCAGQGDEGEHRPEGRAAEERGHLGPAPSAPWWRGSTGPPTASNALPGRDPAVRNRVGVTTDASAGTIELQGPLGTVTAKPTVTNGSIGPSVRTSPVWGSRCQRVGPTRAGRLHQQMMKDYPMGIKADAIQVTDDGVSGQLSTTNATIPARRQRAPASPACGTSNRGRLTPPGPRHYLSHDRRRGHSTTAADNRVPTRPGRVIVIRPTAGQLATSPQGLSHRWPPAGEARPQRLPDPRGQRLEDPRATAEQCRAAAARRHRHRFGLPGRHHPIDYHRDHPGDRVGLGFISEYRAERATQALHSRVQHSAVARRDGQYVSSTSPTWSPVMSSG